MQPQPPHHPYPQAHQPHRPLRRFATPFNPHFQQPLAHHHNQLTTLNAQGLPSSSTQHPPSLLQPSVHQAQHPQQQPLQLQQPQRRRLNEHQLHLPEAACLGRTSQGDVKLSPLFNTYAQEDREAISAHLLGEKAHRRHAQQQEDERLRSLPQPARKAVPVAQKSRQRKQQTQKVPRSSSSKEGQEDIDAVVGIARPAPLLSPPLSDRSDSSSSASSSHTDQGSGEMVTVEGNACSSSLTSNLTTPPVEPRTLVVAVNKLQGVPARSSSGAKGADVAAPDPRRDGEQMRARLETEYQTKQGVPLPSSSRAQPVVATPLKLKHVSFEDTFVTKASTAQESSVAKPSSSTLPSVPTRLSSTRRAHSEVEPSHHLTPPAKRLATSSLSSGWVPPPPIPDSLTYFDLAASYRKLDAWENEHNSELYVAW